MWRFIYYSHTFLAPGATLFTSIIQCGEAFLGLIHMIRVSIAATQFTTQFNLPDPSYPNSQMPYCVL